MNIVNHSQGQKHKSGTLVRWNNNTIAEVQDDGRHIIVANLNKKQKRRSPYRLQGGKQKLQKQQQNRQRNKQDKEGTRQRHQQNRQRQQQKHLVQQCYPAN